ncbi:MAG: flagellar basal-body MS-ring/collar protein FliF [Planctomycetota bacterium]
MKTIKPYIDVLITIWRENSPAARIGILFLAALCIVAITAVGLWSVQPSYVVLLSDTDSTKVDKVVDALAKENIEYQISGAGGNLLVDKRDFARAKLIARNHGVAEAEASGGSSGIGGMFPNPTTRRHQLKVQLQNHIAASIKSMNVIDDVEVLLNVPDKGPFERKKSPPSASVLLTLRPDESLTERQATSIAAFVANAVEDLKPEAVQVTDRDGRSYNIPDEETHQITNQIEYVAHAEDKLSRKAETQLVQFLGLGNASVEVSLDYTFTNGSRTITKYDNDGKVASEEDLQTTSETNTESDPTGAAGVAENLQSRRRGGGGGDSESKTENIKTSYLVPKTEEVQNDTTPVRNFMTVSVLVNSAADSVKQEDGTLLAGLDKNVEAIVKNAVGFQEDTDTISVQLLPFPSLDAAEPAAAPFNWSNITKIIENASLAIAAALAFVMGLLLLRKVRPLAEPVGTGGGPQLDRERLENVSQLSDLIKENPEVFARIVQSWSGVDQPENEKTAEAA